MANQPLRGIMGLTKRHFLWLFLIAVVSTPIAAYFLGAFTPLMANAASANAASADDPMELKPLPVNVDTVEFVDSIVQSRNYTGTIRARQRSELGFEGTGKIIAIHVDEGSLVEKNQVLAELDTETLKAQKSAILARLAQSKSLLKELNAGPRMEKVRAASANVESAQSQYDNAALNLERRKRIRNSISSEEFDQATFAEQSAKANLDAAKEQLSELETGTRQEKLDAQLSAVKQLDASIEEIDVALSKAKLIAPFSGIVTRRYLDPGSIAQASVPIVKLIDQKNLEAWIGLPVSVAASLEIGSKQEIIVDNKIFKAITAAKIRELNTNTQTQTVLFKLEPPASEELVSGQLCEVAIFSSVETSGFWIPNTALTKGVRGLWNIMVIVKDDAGEGFRIEKRGIEIIKTDSGRVLAAGTLMDGDRIIVDGTHRVAEGQLVVPTE